MIPKIIHYCWFGPAKLSALELRCIASWKKHCPDYQFKLWNEENFDINYCGFTREAYRLGKYAFVSDVARLYALQQEGGVYLDTDMLLLKPLPQRFLDNSYFIGKETGFSLSAGIIGAIAQSKAIETILDYYSKLIFTNNPPLIPEVLNANLNQVSNEELQDSLVLGNEYFYPLPYKLRKFHWKKFVKKETIGVHLWNASWQNKAEYSHIDKLKYFISKYYVPQSFLKYAKDV
ncbi:glycosyltransferase [Mongoliitalea daihaiensis]|uniref:glycosyltransferase n=1 Tax=Mongoliitalea daihaiensis TaxID=2782006 RepID=UPI001F2FD6FD|nr:glycosyltransferase [Mongoliitalea daihaiensis]UJP64171.1 mannosyltransferase [Mongoliitalea daihaiensis]